MFFSVVSAKICITYPENNETAKRVFETLFSNIRILEISKCGTILSDSKPKSEFSLYESCIKTLNTPIIFEKHLLKLKNEDFDAEHRIAFSGTMSDIIAKVSKELEVICAHIDPNTFDTTFHDKIINENWHHSNRFSSNSNRSNSNPSTSSSSNYASFELDAFHMMLILIILILTFGVAIYYLNDQRSVKINRKLVNDLNDKI